MLVPLADERRDALIEALAERVVRHRLEAFAIFLLEAHRPAGYLAANALLAIGPLVQVFFAGNVNEIAALLCDRGNIDRLIARIETLSAKRQEH